MAWCSTRVSEVIHGRTDRDGKTTLLLYVAGRPGRFGSTAHFSIKTFSVILYVFCIDGLTFHIPVKQRPKHTGHCNSIKCKAHNYDNYFLCNQPQYHWEDDRWNRNLYRVVWSKCSSLLRNNLG